ncbi:MAG TPA: PEP-CTERM sorting domain-containing protein [Thermoguttaceae bacterium]|nr:PEP-CTERM sorting domain-containing protein [Thermoguttaceae bacterium]
MKHASVIVCIAGCLQLAGTALAAATFYPLGMLDEGDASVAYGLSGDGRVAVGFSRHAEGWEAFRWTARDGMVGLGELPGGIFYSEASDVSYDGSVIVGISADGEGYQAVRWTTDGDTIHAEVLCPGQTGAVSDDGTVVTGLRYAEGNEPSKGFRWTTGQGVVDLPDLATGQLFYYPLGISPDGSVVVGRSSYSEGPPEGAQAVRWTAESGSVGLGDLPGGDTQGWAYDVSADGSVVVGRAVSEHGSEPFRWTPETQMVGLGDFPGGDYAGIAWAVTPDGALVVGYSKSDLGEQAFLWDETHGMRKLQEVLEAEHDLLLPGWQLTRAKAVSADGLTIVGDGINPAGEREAWMVVIPEPSTLVLSGTGVFMFVVWCSRRNRRRSEQNRAPQST